MKALSTTSLFIGFLIILLAPLFFRVDGLTVPVLTIALPLGIWWMRSLTKVSASEEVSNTSNFLLGLFDVLLAIVFSIVITGLALWLADSIVSFAIYGGASTSPFAQGFLIFYPGLPAFVWAMYFYTRALSFLRPKIRTSVVP